MSKIFTRICKASTFLIGFIITAGIMFILFKPLVMPHDAHAVAPLTTQTPVCKTLSIPAIKLELPIEPKITKENMKHGACQVNQTDYPGMTGNLVLAGHNYVNDTLFSNLDKLKVGQKIIINHYYVYQVDDIRIVQSDYQFKHDEQKRLTLYTCLKENNPDYRLIVQGHLIKRKLNSNATKN